MGRHDLTDTEWERLESLLPPPSETGRPPVHSSRQMLSAMFWILRTGAPWRDLPARYPPWKTVYGRFNKWRAEGVWDNLLDTILEILDQHEAIEEELWLIDGTSIRAHRAASGAGKKGDRRNQITMILADLAED